MDFEPREQIREGACYAAARDRVKFWVKNKCFLSHGLLLKYPEFIMAMAILGVSSRPQWQGKGLKARVVGYYVY